MRRIVTAREQLEMLAPWRGLRASSRRQAADDVKHKIRWFVYDSDGNKTPSTSMMRGSWPGYDAECSCGWGSSTGGAVKRSIADAVWDHKYDNKLHPFQRDNRTGEE